MSLAANSVVSLLTAAPEPCRIRNQAGLLRAFFLIRLKTRNAKRYCWSGNEYLAKELGVSVDSVTRYINRLVALGALAIEHIAGVQRRLRVLVSAEVLKSRLFPGHKSHWREAAPEPKPSARTGRKTAPESSEASPPRSSFCPSFAEGVAEGVAEGQYRESRRDSLQTSPTEKGQQTDTLPEGDAQSQDTEVVSAAVSLLAESAHISLPEARSIARDPQVQKATKGLSQGTIKHILTCFRAAKARGSVKAPGAWLRAALRSPEGYSAPAPPATHPSETRAVVAPRPATARPSIKPDLTAGQIAARQADPNLRRLQERIAKYASPNISEASNASQARS